MSRNPVMFGRLNLLVVVPLTVGYLVRAAEPVDNVFRGAPEPKQSTRHNESDRAATQAASRAEPVSPEEEKTRFTTAPGFEIELVASEDIAAGFGKFVAIDWDQHGNLWTMTALEYPVDANENPAIAKELYASKARDKVLVYDRDSKSPTGYASKPRVFADGLAIPLGILPYKNGVYVQHGPDIVFLSDTDGDGKANKREVVLSGFGVQDSHLFPHQFTRAPGNWIWFAQGAFNYGKVKTTRGKEVQFDQTRMAKFRYDGSDFDITSQGPCNIWGLHLTMEGETWIQEANDYGYPAMPFHEYANYPGCSQAQWKSYAPEFPGTAPHFAMGGTGLSGLAMTDKTGWPVAYCDVIYIANPITRKIQAIKARRDGPRYALTRLPDFVQSGDEMFRPVALRSGPDGCLYVVDWYNRIISHNEVPRNHPERDKKRGRIWRVRPSGFKPLEVPDFTKASGDELIAKLGGENTTQSHLAWQAIGDRGMNELAPKLKAIVADPAQTVARRVASLWALESLQALDDATVRPLFADSDRNLRREAVRVLGSNFPSIAGASQSWGAMFDALDGLADDADPQVRSEVIKVVAVAISRLPLSSDNRTGELLQSRAYPIMAKLARPALDAPTMKSTQNGKIIKAGEAYEREFERYLVRFMLERNAFGLAEFLDSSFAKSLPVENRLLLALALPPKVSARRVAELLPLLVRGPGQEELLRLAQFADEPGVGEALKKILQQSAASAGAIEALLKVRTKLDTAKINPLLTDAAKQLLTQNNTALLELGVRLASSFQLASVEPELVRVLEQGWSSDAGTQAKEIVLRPESLGALQALRDLKSERVDLFAKLAEKGGSAEQQAAVAALAASRNPQGPQQLATLYPNLNTPSRHVALAALTGTKPGATALVKSIRSGAIGKDELDGAMIEKLQAVLGNDKDLAALLDEMDSLLQPMARFNGQPDTFVWTKYKLAGPFTVECWLKLDPGINNEDGILAGPGQLDMNFHDSRFRVWVGGGQHDIVIANKKTVPDVWTHYAVTRGAEGVLRIYINGQLDATSTLRNTNAFEQLDVGRTNPKNGGTAGWMNEFRLWRVARSAEQILADFDRTYRGEVGVSENPGSTHVPGLFSLLTGTQWPSFHGSVRIQKTLDAPPLMSSAESKALAERFQKLHALADGNGDAGRGKAIFGSVCMSCHSVGGQGGQVGPVLNGAGALGMEALLRNILTPNAAMEPGYRVFRVELKDGDVIDGIRVSEDKDAIVLRRPNMEDTRIPQGNVKRAAFTRTSMMPEGLLDPLPPEQVTDLFAYLKTLK